MPNIKYVLFEGIDGSGKTKLVLDVGQHIRINTKLDPLVTREPGTTADPICTQIRGMLKSGVRINKSAEVFLFMADRAQHTEFVIKPALLADRIVLQDRGFLSTYAYQGFGRSWSHHTIKRFNAMASIRPDLIVMMTTDLKVAWNRIKDRQKDQFEAKSFQARVQEGFTRACEDATNSSLQGWAFGDSAWPWRPPSIMFIDGAKDHTNNVTTVAEAILGIT